MGKCIGKGPGRKQNGKVYRKGGTREETKWESVWESRDRGGNIMEKCMGMEKIKVVIKLSVKAKAFNQTSYSQVQLNIIHLILLSCLNVKNKLQLYLILVKHYDFN